MNTKINITYKDGMQYTLEYDRSSVKLLEANGLKIDEFLNKPMSNVELAFAGAFIKNHSRTPQTKIDEIYASLKDKDKLVTTLVKMISETYDSLFDEGNVEWDVEDYSNKKNQ